MPKKKSTPKKKSANFGVPAQDTNNNITVPDNKKKKPKNHLVSYDGNKDGQHTNLHK
jgi:hypothetical protein